MTTIGVIHIKNNEQKHKYHIQYQRRTNASQAPDLGPVPVECGTLACVPLPHLCICVLKQNQNRL